MPTEVFVYKQSSSLYDHIATVFDIQTYPTTPTVNIAFYRQDSVTQAFDNPSSADTAAETHFSRVNDLVAEFVAGAADFDGTPVTTILDGS